MTPKPSATDLLGATFEGSLEVVDGARVVGWAWNSATPNEPIQLDLYVGDQLRSTLRADVFRQDLLEAGKGDGRHGFVHTLLSPPARGQEVCVLVTETDIEIFGDLAGPPTDLPMPPLEMIRTVGLESEQELRDASRSTLYACRRFGRLRPDGRVLDVGCGIGRLAIPLTQLLGPKGTYDGVDVIREMIEWSRAHIAPGRSNFRFHHLDVHNAVYNPAGTTKASETRLPFADDSFTLAFLGSVFTHLLPPELERYLSEVARVLRPGGRCLISYFVLENGVLKRPEGKSGYLGFQNPGDGYRTSFPVAELGVAYEEHYLRDLYAHNGLAIAEPILWGVQDMIVAVKQPATRPVHDS